MLISRGLQEAQSQKEARARLYFIVSFARDSGASERSPIKWRLGEFQIHLYESLLAFVRQLNRHSGRANKRQTGRVKRSTPDNNNK